MPSGRFIAAITDANSSECAVHLVTIDRDDFAQPLRFATGGEDVESNGDTFEGRAMQVTLPGESAELGARRGRLVLDNTDRTLTPVLRMPGSKPSVRIDIVLASHPDDIELSWPGLTLDQMRPGGGVIECELAPRDDSTETWPVQALTPSRFPGLFTP